MLVKDPLNDLKKTQVLFRQEKARHQKTQVIADKKTKKIICTAYGKGSNHDFKLFKASKTHIHHQLKVKLTMDIRV
jgi:hypothetical protein